MLKNAMELHKTIGAAVVNEDEHYKVHINTVGQVFVYRKSDGVPICIKLTAERYEPYISQPINDTMSTPDSARVQQPEFWQQVAQVADPYAPSNLTSAIIALAKACASDDDGTVTAHGVLARAAGHMQARAATYDEPGGERSMGKAVMAFNAITGRDLDGSEGWLLLQLLKNVRLFTADGYHKDSAEDAAAYTALMAEAKAAEAALDERLANSITH